jgi:hypothetical protein
MRTDGPLLTVAIPTCNGARHLRDALASVLGQDVDFQLLVSDDRSEDDTLSIVRDIAGSRARISRNAERLGLARNWNQCVALADTPWVAVFHQDDLMLDDHLAQHLTAIQAHPHLGMVCSGADVIDERGDKVRSAVGDPPVLRDCNELFEPGEFVIELADGNPVRCSAVTLNRAAHQALGGFDPALRYAVDWAFWLALAKREAVAWCCHRTVAVRWHAASETHRFRDGTVDLDEQRAVTDEALAWLARHEPQVLAALTLSRDRRLARAYLNRAYTAACDGNRPLEARCLRRALSLSKTTTGSALIRDPRLVARLLLGQRASGLSQSP